MILDTSVVIEKVNNGEEITENITAITLIEYPPIRDYNKFRGNIFFINEDDQIQAYNLQIMLRDIGSPMSSGDLLISAICINRNEVLVTKDRDFLKIQEVEPRFRVIVKE